jgi:hypothetical protein
MKELNFNFKDLFLAPRLALSLQRIWINGIGLVCAYFVYLIVTYISLLLGGYNFSQAWSHYGLLPCAFAAEVPWYSMIIYLLGFVVFMLLVLLTNTAVSRAVYMTLREELFYTWTQALRFAIKKWISTIGSLLTFVFIIGFFIIAAIVMSFIGRIPIVGELGTVLFTIPYIFAALLLFFIILTFFICLLFVPAIIATSDEDALGGVFQSFSITFNQPWRILFYTIIVIMLSCVGFFILAVTLKFSYDIFLTLFSVGMGEKIVDIQHQALYVIDNTLPPVYNLIHSLPFELGNCIYLANHHLIPPDVSASIAGSGYIFAFFILIIGSAVVAYGEAILNSGLTLIYIILSKKQEDENLLEREDDELVEEEEEEEQNQDRKNESKNENEEEKQ